MERLIAYVRDTYHIEITPSVAEDAIRRMTEGFVQVEGKHTKDGSISSVFLRGDEILRAKDGRSWP